MKFLRNSFVRFQKKEPFVFIMKILKNRSYNLQKDNNNFWIDSIIFTRQIIKSESHSGLKKIMKKEVLLIDKIVIHAGIGMMKTFPEYQKVFFKCLEKISGQKPIHTYSKNPISGFHLRENMIIGCYVTLRKKYMINFFNRLVKLILPSLYLFRGIDSTQFDGQGNFTISIYDITTFRELFESDMSAAEIREFDNFSEMNKFGLNITFVTPFSTDSEAIEYMSHTNLLIDPSVNLKNINNHFQSYKYNSSKFKLEKRLESNLRLDSAFSIMTMKFESNNFKSQIKTLTMTIANKVHYFLTEKPIVKTTVVSYSSNKNKFNQNI
uniref:50s ribosomal protein l5 n=1 Tax=Prototheca stagnorum TaxID=215448 RepID=A0A2Z6BEM6_9CHLO|nr:50s ribosomal protein l5 [Prototheca stagnorum]BBD20177.1 50s ribosomal protein l5 [Prototheca stagnorum]